MIKKEVMRQPFDNAKMIKKARGIQFTVNERSGYELADEYHAFSAALAEVSQEPVMFGGVEFTIVYTAKMNHETISEFATVSERLRTDFVDSVIDERDGVNWDSNIQIPHRMAICKVYEQLDKKLADHARSGIEVRGTFRSKDGVFLRYNINGTVKSGHPDTSSGNGLGNREVSAQAIVRLPLSLRPTKVRALVMGDDYIAWLYFAQRVDRKQLHAALDAAESAFGILPERGLFDDLRHASFISLTFYRTIYNTYIALPKVGRLMCGLFWTVTPLEGRDPARFASGIAHSFYPLYSTLPFMRTFLKAHMTVPFLDICDDHYYAWAEVRQMRLAAPINWTEEHLIKYGPVAALYDLKMPDGLAGLAYDPVVEMIYRTDVADPIDRLGCVSK
jgi:hypothetical protein